MRFNKTVTARAHFILAVSLLTFLLTGCARQRWAETLQDEESQKITEIISAMQEAHKSCPDSFDADARIFWKSPVADSGVSGYLKLLSPSFMKFIVSNPLGMVVYAFASNGSTFQILDSTERLHIRGHIRTLAIRKELPLILAKGDWFAFLSGHLPSHSLQLEKITRDTTDETVWLMLSRSGDDITHAEQWIHLDAAKRKLLGYLFLDKDGKTIAEISYEDLEGEKDGCLSPKKKIQITELPWGSEIRIELQDIRTDTQFKDSDFSLPIPDGYYKQFQP
jgi:outer membrane lipoprotein-sorting protein